MMNLIILLLFSSIKKDWTGYNLYVDTLFGVVSGTITSAKNADSLNHHYGTYYQVDSVRYYPHTSDDTFRTYTGHGIFKWKVSYIDTSGYALISAYTDSARVSGNAWHLYTKADSAVIADTVKKKVASALLSDSAIVAWKTWSLLTKADSSKLSDTTKHVRGDSVYTSYQAHKLDGFHSTDFLDTSITTQHKSGITFLDSTLYLKDTHGHTQHINKMVSNLEEMANNTLLARSRSYLTCTGGVLTYVLIAKDSFNFLFDYDIQIYSLATDSMSVVLTAGTDATPIANYIYVDTVAGVPTLLSSATEPTGNHIDVAFWLVGAVSGSSYTIYVYSRKRAETETFVERTIRRFNVQGAMYVSGYAPTVTATTLSIGVGSFFNGIFEMNSTNVPTLAGGYYLVNGGGGFSNCTITDSLLFYSDGSAMGAGELANIVFGIVPTTTTVGGTSPTTVKLVAIRQTKPTTVYKNIANAIADQYDATNYAPSNAEVSRRFIPVCRVIVDKNTKQFQVIVSPLYYKDCRGYIRASGSAVANITIDSLTFSMDSLRLYWGSYITKCKLDSIKKADMLDGLHASSFWRVDIPDTNHKYQQVIVNPDSIPQSEGTAFQVKFTKPLTNGSPTYEAIYNEIHYSNFDSVLSSDGDTVAKFSETQLGADWMYVDKHTSTTNKPLYQIKEFIGRLGNSATDTVKNCKILGVRSMPSYDISGTLGADVDITAFRGWANDKVGGTGNIRGAELVVYGQGIGLKEGLNISLSGRSEAQVSGIYNIVAMDTVISNQTTSGYYSSVTAKSENSHTRIYGIYQTANDTNNGIAGSVAGYFGGGGAVTDVGNGTINYGIFVTNSEKRWALMTNGNASIGTTGQDTLFAVTNGHHIGISDSATLALNSNQVQGKDTTWIKSQGSVFDTTAPHTWTGLNTYTKRVTIKNDSVRLWFPVTDTTGYEFCINPATGDLDIFTIFVE